MNAVSASDDDFSRHDLRITSMRRDNFCRLAGKLSCLYVNRNIY